MAQRCYVWFLLRGSWCWSFLLPSISVMSKYLRHYRIGCDISLYELRRHTIVPQKRLLPWSCGQSRMHFVPGAWSMILQMRSSKSWRSKCGKSWKKKASGRSAVWKLNPDSRYCHLCILKIQEILVSEAGNLLSSKVKMLPCGPCFGNVCKRLLWIRNTVALNNESVFRPFCQQYQSGTYGLGKLCTENEQALGNPIWIAAESCTGLFSFSMGRSWLVISLKIFQKRTCSGLIWKWYPLQCGWVSILICREMWKLNEEISVGVIWPQFGRLVAMFLPIQYPLLAFQSLLVSSVVISLP